MEPGLDVGGGKLHVGPRVVPTAAGVGFCGAGADTHEVLLGGGEEIGGFEVAGYEEDAASGVGDGEEALEDVEPAPAGVAGGAVHVEDSEGDEAAEGTREGGGDEEVGNAGAEFGARVPVAEEEGHAREEAAFEEAEEDPGSDEPAEGLHEAGAHADEAPEEGDCGDDAVEAEAFDEEGGGEFSLLDRERVNLAS